MSKFVRLCRTLVFVTVSISGYGGFMPAFLETVICGVQLFTAVIASGLLSSFS
jgi:hypothetical protein